MAGAYVWSGIGSSDVEKAAAENIVLLISKRFAGGDLTHTSMAEGSEVAEFWDSIGG